MRLLPVHAWLQRGLSQTAPRRGSQMALGFLPGCNKTLRPRWMVRAGRRSAPRGYWGTAGLSPGGPSPKGDSPPSWNQWQR